VLGWQESLTPLANLGGNSGLAERSYGDKHEAKEHDLPLVQQGRA
jgi:hypothetical protein